ncbi:ATP-binding protein [Bacteroidaceae bacterium HV4-6-C5C]|nr:ATP-binding protein [Bacteroidaceae bacterium HV4-6-C5C]
MKNTIQTLTSRDTSFAIIAVRCNSDSSTGKRKMDAGTIYKFLQGYEILENDVIIEDWRVEQNRLFDDHFTDNLHNRPHIQISAIVGQNGSGKSSIVEFMMRLINNMAATTFGEFKTGPAAERLHFLNGIDGDMWYMLNNKIFQLNVRNCRVILHEFSLNSLEGTSHRYQRINLVFDNENNNDKLNNTILSKLDNAVLKSIYSNFFYTLVSNHSLYAYNTLDFTQEYDTNEKEQLIAASKENQIFDCEDRCWLHGLFHKNDGYQIPLVITPFRREGNIDVNKENNLAKERLISLLALQDHLRNINGHLQAESLTYIYEPDLDYGYIYLKKRLEMSKLSPEGYANLRNDITKFWGELMECDLAKFRDKPYYSLAIDYLVYKTLKISKQYKEHEEFYKLNQMMDDVYNVRLLRELIKAEAKDLCHITRKVLQTLAYLLYDVYPLEAKTQDSDGKIILLQSENSIGFYQLGIDWYTKVINKDGVETDPLKSAVEISALMPPPFLETRINLHEKNNPEIKIAFETLSSGERQHIYAISSLLYHLDNLNSVINDKNNPERIVYSNVNIILEEIELYFHPELQQQFVEFLLDSIGEMNLGNIKGISIMLITHSPYVLSDVPKSNVLALRKENNEDIIDLKTFGANIHDMLKDSFFLSNGSLGYFAQWEIGHIMACLKVHEWALQKEIDITHCPFIGEDDAFEFLERYTYPNLESKERLFSYECFSKDLSDRQLLLRINLIDEPVLRKVLLEEFLDIFPTHKDDIKAQRIAELKEEIIKLENE